MDIWIYGKRIRALVDTGSTLTYIGNEVQTLLESRRVLPRDHQRTVQLADGTCVSSIKVYPITVNANGKTTQLLASALRTLAEPVILGMDFLRQRQASLTIDGIKLGIPAFSGMNPPTANNSREKYREQENSRHIVISTEINRKTKRRLKAKKTEPSRAARHMTTVVAQNGKEYKRMNQHKSLFSIKMERKPTRPAPLGKIKTNLRQTRMPRHVPRYVPPFEARPKIHSVEQSEVAKSGNREIDEIAGKIWEARKNPLHATSGSPPPLAPLSHTPITEHAREAEPSTSTTRENEAADYLNDILTLSTPDLSEDDDYEDPFRGITIQPPKSGKRHKWMVYPKGRPKVEVMVRNGIARLRCQGKEKVFSIEHQ